MLNINKEELTELFYQNKPIRDIAKHFSCGQRPIYNRIKKLNLVRNKIVKYEELTGQKFNKLTFLKYVKLDKFGKALWECQCDCGKIKTLNASAIKANLTTSCGCNKSKALRKNGYESISYSFWKKLKKSAISRDIDFDLSIEFLWDKYKQQNGKCALSGVDIVIYPDSNKERLQTASPDRIDSSKGYTKDNFQWVHKRVNRLKNILDEDELLFWCKKIVDNHTNIIQEYDTNTLTWD